MNVKLIDLRFAYDKPVLNIGSLSFDQSTFIYGPSGCGKSTLLALLGGVKPPHSGEIQIGETKLNNLSQVERDRFRGENMGYIFQQFNLIPYLSARENIELVGRFFPKRAAQPDELLSRLDLSQIADKQSKFLSVGEQQRVAIARAIIGNPKLIIADEPTSALDARRQDGFIDLLLEEASRSGALVLFVSHDERLASHFENKCSLPEVNKI